MPSNRSRQSATRVATEPLVSNSSSNGSCASLPFHSKPSCNRKNSMNAGSSDNCPSFFGVDSCCSPKLIAEAFRRWPGVEAFDLEPERHICASMPSICRKPFRIFCVSLDAILSKARDKRASIVNVVVDRLQQDDERPAVTRDNNAGYQDAVETSCLGTMQRTARRNGGTCS
jgi:hypothetical protein